MTKVDLDALEQLEAAATKGPWTKIYSGAGSPFAPHICVDTVSKWLMEADLTFLAALRNAFPALAAELKELRAENNKPKIVIDGEATRDPIFVLLKVKIVNIDPDFEYDSDREAFYDRYKYASANDIPKDEDGEPPEGTLFDADDLADMGYAQRVFSICDRVFLSRAEGEEWVSRQRYNGYQRHGKDYIIYGCCAELSLADILKQHRVGK